MVRPSCGVLALGGKSSGSWRAGRGIGVTIHAQYTSNRAYTPRLEREVEKA